MKESPMTIEIYKSALCPRCAYALYTLRKLQEEYKNINIISYDIMSNPKAFKEAGIKMIPSIQIKTTKKSWILPRSKDIRSFVLEHM